MQHEKRIFRGGLTLDKHIKMGKGVRFERIRRITGYLVGTLDKWNDAKKAEEKDRVKHGMSTKNDKK